MFCDARRELVIARIKDKPKIQVVASPTEASAPTDIEAELGEGDLND